MDTRTQELHRTALTTNDWADWQAAARNLTRSGLYREAESMLQGASAAWRARNDAHRPSVINPSDYSFVMAVSWGIGFGEWKQIQMRRLMELHRTQPFFVKESGRGQCDICGAWFMHGAVYRQNSTNDHIVIGWICADKMDLLSDEAFTAKKQTMDAYLRERAKRQNWKCLRVAYASLDSNVRRALKADHDITRDIRSRFARYLTISERQATLLLKLESQVNAPPKPEEKHVNAPAEGRQVIEGTVVSLKWRETEYGDSLKMTVKIQTLEGSWLAWGTCPRSLVEECEKGNTVRFTGTLKHGDTAHFAFYSRPSKASIV